MNKAIEQYTEELEGLIYQIVRQYAGENKLHIKCESTHDIGEIVIKISGELE